jgi:hypothetical protein
MIKKNFGMVVLAALVCLLPATCFADTAGWEFSTIGTEFTNNTWNFGEVFTVNQNIMVDFLGYYNPSTGMTANHEVALYDSSGNQLADTVVTSSSLFMSTHWLYNQITPVELLAGQTYVVQGLSQTDLYAYNDNGFQTFAPITILGDTYEVSTTMDNNQGTNVGCCLQENDGFWGANFGWAPVTGTPEPGSLMMIGTGLLGLAAFARRKKNA